MEREYERRAGVGGSKHPSPVVEWQDVVVDCLIAKGGVKSSAVCRGITGGPVLKLVKNRFA